MVIQNQLRNAVYNFDVIERVFVSSDNEICAYSQNGCFHKLAVYSTRESAKEVFENFCKAVSTGKRWWFFPPNADFILNSADTRVPDLNIS